MASKETALTEIPPIVKHAHAVEAHIWVRFLAAVSTLAASCIILTAKQSINLFGVAFYAKYSYSSVFKFFAIANLIACGSSVVSMFIALIPWRKVPHPPTNYFYMFLHDLVVMALLMGGCAAATAIGYVGRYGNSHTGWMPICDHFAKFCSRVTISVTLSYLSFFLYLALSIISANKSRQIIVE
ncbi:hypothetical protein LguiB_008071 [Lonicera macranthoides]